MRLPDLRTLASVALLSLTAGAAQSPNLAPPVILPGDAGVGPAYATQGAVAMATGGGVTLVVWGDTRAATSDVFGIRLDASGALLDPLPFPIDTSPGEQGSPQVEWNGESFLVAWISQEPTQFYYEDRLRAVRVSPQGDLLDATPLELPDEVSTFALGTDGSVFLLVKQGPGPVSEIDMLGFRVSGQGQLLDPTGVLLHPGSYFMIYDFDVEFAGGTWLFAWGEFAGSTGWNVLGRRFAADLTSLDATPVALAATSLTEVEPSLSSNGTQFLLVYWHQDTYWSQGILGRRFDRTLQTLDAAPIAISGSGKASYQPYPSAIWDGSQWIAAWSGIRATRAARISAAGVVLDPGGVPLHGGTKNNYSPAIAPAAAGGAHAAWGDIRNGSSDVYGATFTSSGLALPELALATGLPAQGRALLCANGVGYLAVAHSATPTGARILAWRTDALGNALDAGPIEVAQGTSLGVPSVAWNGSLYLLAWPDSSSGQREVLGRRMLADGTFIDAAPFLALEGHSADVAAVGDLFLVVAAHYPTNPEYIGTYAARVRGTDGVVLDAPSQLVTGSFSVRPRVTALADRWMVLTERHWTHDESSSSITACTVGTDGALGNNEVLATVSVQFSWGGSIDVASSGTAAIVTYVNGSNWTNTDVYVRPVDANGAPTSASIELTDAAPSGQFRPSIAWDGAQYALAYESYEDNPLFYDQRPDVYVQRLEATGTPLDAAGHPAWQVPIAARYPEVASLGGGKSMLSASVFETGAYEAFRAEVRALRPDGLESYGTGTAGCSGAHRIDANEAPTVGSTSFAITCDNAPPGGVGFALLATAADEPGSDPFLMGILLHVDPIASLLTLVLPVAADAQGHTSLVQPLPTNPAFAGFTFHAQAAFFWVGPCSPSPSGFSTSDGLHVTLQP